MQMKLTKFFKTKILPVSLVLMQVMLCTACGAEDAPEKSKSKKQKQSTEEFMADVAKEVTDNLAELVEDDNYLALLSTSQETAAYVNSWKGASIDKKEEVTVITFSDDALDGVIAMAADETGEDVELSKLCKDYLSARMASAFMNAFNGRFGVAMLAASAAMNYSKSYYFPGGVDQQIWIIPTKKEGLGFALTFTNSGDDIVSVSASFTNTENLLANLMAMNAAAFSTDVDQKKIEW